MRNDGVGRSLTLTLELNERVDRRCVAIVTDCSHRQDVLVAFIMFLSFSFAVLSDRYGSWTDSRNRACKKAPIGVFSIYIVTVEGFEALSDELW